MGNRRADVIVVIKNGQPGAHSVRHLPNQACIDAVLLKAEEDVLPGTGEIREGDELRRQAEIAEVFSHVPADAAMNIPDLPGIPAAGNIGSEGVSLDIHKDGADHRDAHIRLLLSLFFHLTTDPG